MAHHIMSSGRNRLALRAPEGDQEQDNPFAPPPEGAPDRPWTPRRPEGSPGTDPGSSGPGSPDGGTPPPPPPGRRPGAPQAWGSQWGNRPQDGRDPYGRRPDQGPNGPQGTGPRFDPTDPAQRRSRYALVCGGWGLIFAVLGWVQVGLLLGALALYWGISALRMSPEDRAEARATAASALADATQTPRPTPPAPGPDAQRSFKTAAWTGIITSAVTIAIVASSFALHLAYRDYYTCKQDALTTPASQSCQKLLPEPLRSVPALRQ
ncbi:hypothetical protein [Streptomyces sp. NBC_01198]|uniref:hypothetical protein n=1 Tax=Streptomyces sp. NBC_01198 TaxID=2903769 RepID=UPI002E10ACDB|nr:hypothetical protein OG702_13575 [Streptomyces sp. NBC_01198]